MENNRAMDTVNASKQAAFQQAMSNRGQYTHGKGLGQSEFTPIEIPELEKLEQPAQKPEVQTDTQANTPTADTQPVNKSFLTQLGEGFVGGLKNIKPSAYAGLANNSVR